MRFKNEENIPYSAIYLNGAELFSCERNREQNMIKYWNGME